jgi:hypothetical protein
MPPDRDPLRVFAHALRAGDRRLAELIALRLGGAPLTLLRLSWQLGI